MFLHKKDGKCCVMIDGLGQLSVGGVWEHSTAPNLTQLHKNLFKHLNLLHSTLPKTWSTKTWSLWSWENYPLALVTVRDEKNRKVNSSDAAPPRSPLLQQAHYQVKAIFFFSCHHQIKESKKFNKKKVIS